MDALAFMPATELAARIRDGTFSAGEVVEAAVRRIEAIDPELGAFIEVDPEAALACRSRSRRAPPSQGGA